LNFPAYTALVEKSVPTRQRGRMYGWGNGVGGLLGIGGAWLAERWLATLPFPGGYARCFWVGVLILTVSILPLGFLREPPNERPAARRRWGAYLGQVAQLLRADRHFARYVGATILQTVGMMGMAFYTVYALDALHAPEEIAARFTQISMAARLAANPLWGHAIDRWGNRRVLVWGSLCLAMTPAAALAAPSVALYGAVFALSALASSAVSLAGYTWVMEAAPSEQVPTYISLGTTLLAPFKLAVPLIGGGLAEVVGYPIVFIVGLAASLASLPLMARLYEPRHNSS
jgi:MFS family permease